MSDDVDIDALFEKGNAAQLQTYLRLLHPADIAELFRIVDEDKWLKITRRLTSEILAEVFAELDESRRERLGQLMDIARLTAVVDELETDDAADVLADLPPHKSQAVLEAVEARADIEVLLAYPADSAGGIMQREVCRVRRGRTVRDAIESVRKARERVDEILEAYLVDDEGRLQGIIALQDLVLAEEHVTVDAISAPAEHTVVPEVDQEEVAATFLKYNLTTLPVVNAAGILLGRITFDDIHEVLEEEASEDILVIAGAAGDDLVYSTQFWRIALLRLPWLATAMGGSLVTGYILTQLTRIPGDAIVMAAFVPTVMAMTGNLGSQSAMIITRGLSTGRVDLGQLGRSFFRETMVGLIMGISVGAVVALIAYLWHGRALLGLAVGASISCSMTVAAALGVAFPALFKRIGVDPAIAAGPLVTTGCDILAVFVYLNVGLLLLR